MARPDPAAVPGLAEAVDALYVLAPGDFTARRDELTKAARADRDRALAAAIAKLRRPTLSAWALNLLVREEPDLVQQLVELGALLREAQSGLDGPALKELDRQRRGVVGALARRAGALVGEHGQRLDAELSRQVEQSLGAALADPEAAAAVTSGQLTRPVDNVGFGVEVSPDAVAVPDLVLVGSTRRRATSSGTASRAEPDDDDKGSPSAPESLDDARARRTEQREARARDKQEREDRAREEREREREAQQRKEREARRAAAEAALEAARAAETEAGDAATQAAERLEAARAALAQLEQERDELAARLAEVEEKAAWATTALAEHEQQQDQADQALSEARDAMSRAERDVEADAAEQD